MNSKFLILINCLILIFTVQLTGAQTKLYQSLYEGMNLAEFENEIKENPKKYNQINFGKEVVWEIDQNFCVFENNELKIVVLKPAGNRNGINYIKTVNHLKTSKEYLESRSYQLINEHELWYSPQRFVSEEYPYALLFEGPNDNIVVKINTERFKGNYMPSISITSIKNRKLFEVKEEIYSESGF